MKLVKNTILITGGSSGIGFELAKRLIELDNKVLICGRSNEKLEKAKKELPALRTIQCDLSNTSECQRLAKWIFDEYSDLNILINNAALVHAENFIQGKDMIEKARLEFNTNTLAPIALSNLLLPVLMNNHNPAMINVTTGLVYVPKAAYPFYNATKAALHAFTKVLRYQLKLEKIKIVEAMFPAVDTPWHKGNVPKIAISVKRAVDEMISGLEKGNEEIRIGKVNLIYWMSRIAPKFAFYKLNSLK